MISADVKANVKEQQLYLTNFYKRRIFKTGSAM